MNLRRVQPGFTLMELIVAVALAGFVMLIFNQIFSEAARSMRRGVQTSDIISKSRAIDEQLRRESKLVIKTDKGPTGTVDLTDPENWVGAMVGPRGNTPTPESGFLVIVNHAISAPVTENDAFDGVVRNVRSDQLMFVLRQGEPQTWDGSRLPPLAPSENDRFGGDFANSAGDSLVAPTTIPETDYLRIWYGHGHALRENGAYNAADDLGSAAGINHIAADWVLARHALFLTGNRTALPITPVGSYYATGIGPRAGVNNYPGRFLYEGLTDVSNVSLPDLTDSGGALSTAFLPDATAFRNAFFDPDGIAFTQDRMRVLSSPKDPALRLTAEQIAPMHPYFAENVSDFIVDFAHDYDDNEITTDAYPAAGDGLIDRVDADGDGTFEIRWYSAIPNTTDTNFPFTYRPPEPLPTDLYDNNAWDGASTYPYASGGAFVWGPEDKPTSTPTPADQFAGEKRWPWLIRIRYRLHDRSGDFMGRTLNQGSAAERLEPGQWFEIIIPVNRQPS